MEADEEGNNDDAPPAKGGGRAIASVMRRHKAKYISIHITHTDMSKKLKDRLRDPAL